MTDEAPPETDEFNWRGKRRGPGRPRGSANKAPIVMDVAAASRLVPVEKRMPDVADMISAQLQLIQSAQADMTARLGTDKGCSMREIAELSSALDKAMAAVSRAGEAHDNVLARMSHAQLLESAIRRIEEQDAGTINYVVRRLKAVNDKQDGGPRTASAAISALGDD